VSDNSTNTYEALRQQRDAYQRICETIHKENKIRIFEFFDNTDVKSIHVEFNGSGDVKAAQAVFFLEQKSIKENEHVRISKNSDGSNADTRTRKPSGAILPTRICRYPEKLGKNNTQKNTDSIFEIREDYVTSYQSQARRS